MSQTLHAPPPRAASALAAGCMSDCLQSNERRASNHGDPANACRIRCSAGTSFYTATPAQRARTPRDGAPISGAAAIESAMSVIVVGRPPSGGFGMIVGVRDRLAAFRLAEDACKVSGTDCRPLMESSAACGAVAQGIRRSHSAMVITADPQTWVVTSMNGGFGATVPEAESQALADCRSRDPRGHCQVVSARCGTGRM